MSTQHPQDVATVDVDVIVLGLGVGGEAVAGNLASAGLDVVGVEDGLVGGECPYWGCIPSKAMVYAAARARTEEHPDWAPLAARIRELTADWDDTAAVDRLVDKGMTFVRGAGRITGVDTVEATGPDGVRRFRARHAIVVGTGTRAFVPPIEGLAGTPLWTNREAIEADEAPSSLAVLGGGAIGLELAQVFTRFGTRVTIVENGERVLAVEEPESSDLAAWALGEDGVEIHLGARAERVAHDGKAFTVELSDGRSIEAEKLLVATGRRVDLPGLGAEALGVDPHAHALPVDGQLRVQPGGAAPAVWAVGDVTGQGAFTHVAMYQSAIVTKAVLHAAGRGTAGPDADHSALPRVTFVDPEIGAVGLTEHQARTAGLSVRIGHADLAASSRGHITGARGFVKVIEDVDRGVLVGATTAGPAGGEILGALVVAVRAAVPVATLRNMMYAYPTYHRTIESALADLDTD
ncbi:dihydrolipoyl dehydrogenase family protein [Embleya hyalina]|uniref:Pyridine nucleotide-disulfide oxidoreductase n=1 Tax=Embleya hyalina TaxID=516124 RepID=A0A401YLI8_9ACTN|nr:NAD(P)/FAD-dependent oxidoreductase [Embleya hyalina]GCD95463.1 pyridine nucleotide-disulfide oxidoreductase [Embleya hyalina]